MQEMKILWSNWCTISVSEIKRPMSGGEPLTVAAGVTSAEEAEAVSAQLRLSDVNKG